MLDRAPAPPQLRPLTARDPALASRGECLAGGWLRFSEIEALEPGSARGEIVPLAAAEALYPEAADQLARLKAARTGLPGQAVTAPIVVARGADPRGARVIWPRQKTTTPPTLPLILTAETAAAALAGGAAIWQPPDWDGAGDTGLPDGLKLLTPAPPRLTDVPALRQFYDAAALQLDALERAGLSRERVIMCLGSPDLPVFGALSLMQGLGCALLLDVDEPGRAPTATAAAGVVAAAQGVQFIATARPTEVSAAIAAWLEATGGAP